MTQRQTRARLLKPIPPGILWLGAVWVFYLDVVQDELVPLLGRGHLAVSDGLSQRLLGNEGVQVQHGGQAAVETDEFVLVGAEVD